MRAAALVAPRRIQLVDLPPAPLGPHESIELPLPCDVPSGGAEVHLTVRFALRKPTWFAPAGHVVAWDQFELRPSRAAKRAPVVPNDHAAPVDEVLLGPVELTLWRAATDNDGFKLMPDLAQRIGVGGRALWKWLDAGIDPHEVPGWLRAGCWDPRAARSMAEEGLSPLRLLDDHGDPLDMVEGLNGELVPLAMAVADHHISATDAVDTVVRRTLVA